MNRFWTAVFFLMAVSFFFFVMHFAAPALWAASPPYHSKDPGTQANFEDIYNRIGSLRLIRDPDPAPRTNATPRFAGDFIYNSTDLELCYATGTLKTQWVLAGSKTTPCSH